MPRVTLSVASGWTGGALVAPRDIVQTDGVNTLTMSRIAVVIRKLELKKRYQAGCSVTPSTDPSCETFAVGPLLVELPLNQLTRSLVSVDVPPGAYDEVEFEIHKPDDDTPGDLQFLEAHPEFRRVSVRVEGDFNGGAFVFTQDLNESLEADLEPHLYVNEDDPPTNITLRIDARTWFWDGNTLVNPFSALKGEENEKLVEDNIEDSIRAFPDHDWDGQPDAN